MDPLHPLVPIHPPAPTPPDYSRVERVDRDGQQQDTLNWQRDPGEDAEEEEQERFEDDYDPDWSDPAGAEPYGPDGTLHDAAATVEVSPEPRQKWDPGIHPERRAHPRDEDDDADPEAGQHIDIGA
ncbi:MAG: hypothetical protein ACRDLT_16925 [Solirubrobacteraceae bacterium]